MNKKKNRKDHDFNKDVCAFCNKPSDEKKCGKFFTSKLGFSVHQYCMFFSAALPQNGRDDEGFEGFLEQDVLKEVKRASRLKCSLCSKKGASAGCCDVHCKRGFHFSCGVTEKYLFQFFGQFRAYCVDHRLHQNTPSYPSKKVPCPICLESVRCKASPDILTTPCCKDVWLHRSCVQEQATVSGYFFRCAVCNDKDKFVQEMKRMGIYVPDRDAAWEDGNNFAELLEKYASCDYQSCRCPMGRKYSTDSGKWELVLCSSCGQYGTHVGCKEWATNPPSLLCPTCRPIHEVSNPATPVAATLTSNQGGSVAKSSHNRKGGKRPRKRQQHVDSDTDSDDILNVVNGLKRQAEDDFLNSDTNFFVQRAIAAGTAAMQPSGSKKFQTGQSAAPIPSGYSSNRKRKAKDAESDDEIMITKYVPGQKPPRTCQICPKCHGRKSVNTGAIPRTGISSRVGGKSGATCTITKADVEQKEAGYESEGFVAERGTSDTGAGKRDAEARKVDVTDYEVLERGKLDTGSGKRDVEVRKVNVADFEVLELAAEHTHKSSVLLLPSEDKKALQGDNITKDSIISEQQTKSTSLWQSSVEKLLQFFNPHSSPETNEEKSPKARRLSERSREKRSRELAFSKNLNLQNAEIDKEVSNLTRGNSDSKDNKQRSEGEDDVWLKLSEELPASSRGKSDGTGKQSASFGKKSRTSGERSALVGKTSEAIGDRSVVVGKSSKKSETAGERSESLTKTSETRQNFDCNSNATKFSNSVQKSRQFLNKKAVLEAVIDHAMELKNSGKELTHRCVSSC